MHENQRKSTKPYENLPKNNEIKRKTKKIITETMKNALEIPFNDEGGLLDEKNLISDEPNVE